MLAAWAEATERVEIGALVTCNSYRNPQLLADMARTVDHISDGRLILGIGSGWFERDYDEYGYEFGTAGRPARRPRPRPAASSRRAGRRLNPPPTRDIPVLIGGGGERKTLRIVAEHADIWHGFGAPETIAHKHAVLDEWCAEAGPRPRGDRAVGRGVRPARARYREDVADYAAGAEALHDRRHAAVHGRAVRPALRPRSGPRPRRVAGRPRRLACDGAPRRHRAPRRAAARPARRAPCSSPSTGPTGPG